MSIFTAGMAHVELTPTQFTALLKTVELGRITQNHLGRLAAMDPATIQGVVRRLMARGLMRRSQTRWTAGPPCWNRPRQALR